MLMHRKGQSRGAAGVGQAANKVASLAVRETTTSEFLRHKYREQLRSPHLSIIFRNKFIVVVVGSGTLREGTLERGQDFLPICGRAHGDVRLPVRFSADISLCNFG
jgi:hypothetical protein